MKEKKQETESGILATGVALMLMPLLISAYVSFMQWAWHVI